MLFWIGIVLPILLSIVKGYEQCTFLYHISCYQWISINFEFLSYFCLL